MSWYMLARFASLGTAILMLGAATPAPQSSDLVDVAAANAVFGFRLLSALQKAAPSENIVISPASASLALAMARNGTSGQTALEMAEALALPGVSQDQINRGNAALIKQLQSPAEGVTLNIADSLWADSKRVALRASFVELAKAFYNAEVADVDFSDPDTPARINAWVGKKTHGKIDKIIDRLNPSDVALLLNALYFKGQWTHKFDPAQTKPHDFTLASGTTKKVPLMSQHGKFEYFETPAMQAIRLPYGKGDLIMDIFLPAKSSSLAALEEQLTARNWESWQSGFVETPGDIALPRYELKAEYGLNDALKALGMRQAFDPAAADFHAMFEPAATARGVNFFISYVKQATYLKVDEEGSEAAAVTSIGITTTAFRPQPPPFHMVVDRPFLCVIEDLRTKALLFVGAIYDPSP